ncbi:MAG: VOC family protein [Planctomycetes bacterium]|nr:VOC family protein [Planctomycetota bacterium]
MTVKHLDHLNMTVHDLEETAAWYGRVFGFVVVERGRSRDGTPFAILRSGEAMLCVYEHPERGRLTDEARDDLPVHGLSHFALRITDGAAWERTVAAQGLEVRYGGAVRWPRSTSWYVCDPSGYELEVVLWNDDTVRFAG